MTLALISVQRLLTRNGAIPYVFWYRIEHGLRRLPIGQLSEAVADIASQLDTAKPSDPIASCVVGEDSLATVFSHEHLDALLAEPEVHNSSLNVACTVSRGDEKNTFSHDKL